MDEKTKYMIASALMFGWGTFFWFKRGGKEFVANGIRYRSIPDNKAGRTARKLRKIFKPFGGEKSNLGRGAEASEKGRKLIRKHIYKPLDRANADALMHKLGSSNESYWSSWFFGRVYKHNKMYRDLWPTGTVLLAYPHYRIVNATASHRTSPLNAKGKTIYTMFPFNEAPVSIGDNIIAINRDNASSFDDYMGHKQQGKSHGRVVTAVKGNTVTFNGGNEGGSVGEHTLALDAKGKLSDLDSQGRLIHPGSPNRYTAVMKKVKVLGKDAFWRKIPFRTAIPVVCFGLGSYTAFKAWREYAT